MIHNQDALALISARIDLDKTVCDRVELSGWYSLHELEALCIVLRDKQGRSAVGAEEYLVNQGKLKAHMPIGRLQSIVREHYERHADQVARTMHEDLQQTTNPGSKPVYGTPVEGGGISFEDKVIRDIVSEEFSQNVNELMVELRNLKCTLPMQKIAAAMFFSLVWDEDLDHLLEVANKICREGGGKIWI